MKLRDPSKNDDPVPDYGSSSPLYTLSIHYKGIVENWDGVYIGGEHVKFDHVDPSRYKLRELVKFAAYLESCKSPLLWRWCAEKKQFKPLTTEDDLKLLLDESSCTKEVDLYIENSGTGSTELEESLHEVVIEDTTLGGGDGVKDFEYRKGEKKAAALRSGEEKQVAKKESNEHVVKTRKRDKRRVEAHREEVRKGKRQVEYDEDEDDPECRDSDFEYEKERAHHEDDSDFAKFVDKEAEWGGLDHEGVNIEIGLADVLGEPDLCESEDDFRSIHESDDENPEDRAPVWRPDYRRTPTLLLGMVFSTKKEFRDMLDTHAILENRTVRYVKSDKQRIYAVCEAENCDFRVNALRRAGETHYVVTTCVPDHTCAPQHFVKNMKSRWLASRFGYVFQTDKKRKISAFREDAMAEIRCEITPWQVFMCKQRTVRGLEGRVDDQYSLLWDYAAEIRRTNHGSTVILNVNQTAEGNKFSRFYVCLAALKEGLLVGCRPVIGLDGTFLKGPHGGILLTAVGVDSNNNSYPFAYAVVSNENGENWSWFVNQLKEDLDISNPCEWTVISDKQKGLIKLN